MEIALIILTAMVFISTVVIIGKFFCVSFLETVYDEIADDYELHAGFFITYWMSLFCLVIAWIIHIYKWGLINGDPVMGIIVIVFGILGGAVHNLMVIWQSFQYVFVPYFQKMHNTIKRRKRG
jgi:hypothetical protein